MNQCAAFGYPASGVEVRYHIPSFHYPFGRADAILVVW